MEAASRPLKVPKVPKGSFESLQKIVCWACMAAVMEAAARPLKVPKGSFESLQKSLLGLHGGSNGSCSEGFGAFEGAKGQFRKPTKKLAGPARRQ